MMNATYSRQPFSLKIISEVLSYLSIRYNVKDSKSKIYKSEWKKFNQCTLMSKLKIDILLVSDLTFECALLKYQVAIYGIYIERLLNHR